MSGGGAEREGSTESEAGSGLRAVSTAGLELTDSDHDLSRSLLLNRLSHPGAPESFFFFNSINVLFLSNLYAQPGA